MGPKKATTFRFTDTVITATPDDPAWDPYVLHLPSGIFTGPLWGEDCPWPG